MKRINNILAWAFVFGTLVGCSHEQLEMPSSEESNPSSGPVMEFGVNIGSRAQIIEGGEGTTLDELGLYGYQYANQMGSTWSTAKTTARPNVFDNTPEPLTYEDEDGYYYPSKTYEWTGQKYAFFAHYPFEHSSFTNSPATEPNTPYLTYTVDRSDVSKMADIMTSARTDLTAVNRYVTFHMIHRLSAVDVDVCNIYQYNETTGEGDDAVTTSQNVEIEIHSLVLNFSNLHYASSKIYLDAGGNSVPVEAANPTASYALINDTISIPYKTNEDAENYHLSADNDLSMFFIPQKQDDLAVSVDIKFKKKLPNGTFLTNKDKVYTYDNAGNKTGEENAEGYGTEFFYVSNKSVNFEQSLDEGYRYFVTLNFTSAAVSINIVTAAQWEDSDDIKHEFD